MVRAVSEGYERWMWEELNRLLADAIPSEGTEGEDPIVLAFADRGTETADLYERIKRLARTERGYLRKRMEEDNRVTAARRRLEGR